MITNTRRLGGMDFLQVIRFITTLIVFGILMDNSYCHARHFPNVGNMFPLPRMAKAFAENESKLDVDKLVKFMSIQMAEAERVYELPNLPTLASQLGLNSLVADIVKADLTEELSQRGPLTMVGPTDIAFSMRPEWLKTAMENTTVLSAVLQYHVLKHQVLYNSITNEQTALTLSGKYVRFNVYPNEVVTAQCAPLEPNVDNMASNGVLHELKSVMLLPYGTIAETLAACPDFKTLMLGIQTADLVKLLSGNKPLTIFAPTNEAFAKLAPGVWDSLKKNTTALTDLLKYHVTTETFCSAGLVFFKRLDMLNGELVNVTVQASKLKLNNASLLPAGADGSVTNGVVQAIDTVLFPPSLQLLDTL